MRKSLWVSYPYRVNCCSFVKEYDFHKPFKYIEISITSMGWYHLYIDSLRIDKDVFSTGWTNFKKRVQYQTYIIKPSNRFILRVDLAEGWGGGDRFAWANKRYFLYYPLSLNYQINVFYEDGSKETYYSDESIKVYENQYIDSTIYYGEQVDYRRELKEIGNAKKISIDTKIIPQEGSHIVDGEHII